LEKNPNQPYAVVPFELGICMPMHVPGERRLRAAIILQID